MDEYLDVAHGVGRRLVEEGLVPLYRLPHGQLVVARHDLDARCLPVSLADLPVCLAASVAKPEVPAPAMGAMGIMALLERVLLRVEQALQATVAAPTEGPAGVPAACPEDGFLTVAEVAGILRCSTKTVRRMIRVGTLPASSSSGRAIRIRATDVHRSLRPMTGDTASVDAFIAQSLQ